MDTTNTPLVRIHSRVVGARCPYCHDRVEHGPVRCPRCEAEHHTACAWDHPGCSNCGEDLSEHVREVAIELADAERGLFARLARCFADDAKLTMREQRRIHGSLFAVSAILSAIAILAIWLLCRSLGLGL